MSFRDLEKRFQSIIERYSGRTSVDIIEDFAVEFLHLAHEGGVLLLDGIKTRYVTPPKRLSIYPILDAAINDEGFLRSGPSDLSVALEHSALDLSIEQKTPNINWIFRSYFRTNSSQKRVTHYVLFFLEARWWLESQYPGRIRPVITETVLEEALLCRSICSTLADAKAQSDEWIKFLNEKIVRGSQKASHERNLISALKGLNRSSDLPKEQSVPIAAPNKSEIKSKKPGRPKKRALLTFVWVA